MRVKAIKTRVLRPPKDDLFSALKESLTKIEEKSILVFSSKVVSINEGRCILREKIGKDELVAREADKYLARGENGSGTMLTIKNKIMIPAAGIDVSNGNGYFILWPEKPYESAKKIYEFIKAEYQLKQVGVIIADSHTVPLRWGVLGIGIGYYGINPLRDYREKRDIFGRKSLRLVLANLVDALATAAVTEMGEGDECTPVAVISEVPRIEFTGSGNDGLAVEIDENIDLYRTLLSGVAWKNGGGGKRTSKD